MGTFEESYTLWCVLGMILLGTSFKSLAWVYSSGDFLMTFVLSYKQGLFVFFVVLQPPWVFGHGSRAPRKALQLVAQARTRGLSGVPWKSSDPPKPLASLRGPKKWPVTPFFWEWPLFVLLKNDRCTPKIWGFQLCFFFLNVSTPFFKLVVGKARTIEENRSKRKCKTVFKRGVSRSSCHFNREMRVDIMALCSKTQKSLQNRP